MKALRLIAAFALVAFLSGCFVYIGVNSAPTVSLVATKTDLNSGERSDITAIASDPDGDPISYAWYVDGKRVVDSSANLTYYAPTVSSYSLATIAVAVTDAYGASTRQELTVSIRYASSGTLRVVNDSPSTVWYLYVKLQTSYDWGYDQLGSYTTIPPGGSFDLAYVPSGTYDFRAETQYGTKVWQNTDGTYIGAGLTVTWVLY